MNALRHIAVRMLVAFVIAAASAGAGWWFFVRDTAALATSAPAIPADLQETSTLSSVDSSGIVDYRVLSDRSDSALFADATLAGLTISSGATDATSDISGTLYLSSEGLTLDPSRYSVLTVGLSNLEIGGVATDTGVMATFTATEIDGYDPAIPEGEEQSLQLSGTLDLLSVEAPLTWNVKALTVVVIGVGSIGCWWAGRVADRVPTAPDAEAARVRQRSMVTIVAMGVSGSCCVLAAIFFHNFYAMAAISLVRFCKRARAAASSDRFSSSSLRGNRRASSRASAATAW